MNRRLILRRLCFSFLGDCGVVVDVGEGDDMITCCVCRELFRDSFDKDLKSCRCIGGCCCCCKAEGLREAIDLLEGEE